MFKTQLVCITFAYCIVSFLGQSNINCLNASQCVGNEWVLSYDNQHINGFGYKSLFGPNTSITANYEYNRVLCFAAFACAQISFINNTQYSIDCEGSHSCANIDKLSYINAKYVECMGSNSCENSNIIASWHVKCGASQSCIHTKISSLNVYGYGSHALYASVIDSSNLVINNILNVYLRGYQSGFGAIVICRAGDICNIYCYNNGCEMLYLNCKRNSNCNIVLNNNITIPPIQHLNEYDSKTLDISHITNNELCDNNPEFVYDNYNEHTGIIEINEQNKGPVCCRGVSSCLNTVSIAFTDIASDIVVCSAYDSCRNTIINTTKPVFCEGGFFSCDHTVINKANKVYCSSYSACQYGIITEPTNVYCLGYWSCVNSKIKSNGNDINVYLFGSESGSNTNIHCDIGDKCHIHCGAAASCYGTVLICNNNCFVDCNTDTGCPNGNYTISAPSQTGSPTANVDQSPT